MCLLHTLTFYDCQCSKTQTIPCPAFWTATEYGDTASLCVTKDVKSENLAGACVNCYIKDYPLLVNENFTNRTAAEAWALESESGASMSEVSMGGSTPEVGSLGSGGSTPGGGLTPEVSMRSTPEVGSLGSWGSVGGLTPEVISLVSEASTPERVV